MTGMRKFTSIFFVCCVASSPASKPKQFTQDGISVNVHNDEEEKPPNIKIKRAIINLEPTEVKHISIDDSSVPMSAMELGDGVCQDIAAEHTGLDVHDDTGFARKASCADLANHCHDESIGEQVRVSCPIACYLCTPGEEGTEDIWHGKCFDAVVTGIRFRDGPKATCSDLINYCSHETLGSQVQEACKLSCGLCGLHAFGPYVDQYGNCEDLASHEEPQFTIHAALAGCTDMVPYCKDHPKNNLIRHKCPLTCGVCGNAPSTPPPPAMADENLISPGDIGGCDRRRRWGFCSTRRRRHV